MALPISSAVWTVALEAVERAHSIHAFVPRHVHVSVARDLDRSPDTVDRRYRRWQRTRHREVTGGLSPSAVDAIEDAPDLAAAFVRLATTDPTLDLATFEFLLAATFDRRLAALRAREQARRRIVDAFTDCRCLERSDPDAPSLRPSHER